MADSTGKVGASTAKGWSDSEKVALLMSLIDFKGGVDWKNVTLPPGRTQKACMHILARLKEEAKKEEWYKAATPTTPTAKNDAKTDGKNDGKARGKKRTVKAEDEGEPKKRTKKAVSETPVKEEHEA